MSSLTDRLYWQWRRRNGGAQPQAFIPDHWGIGGMPPMKAQHRPASPAPRVGSSGPAQDVAARPEKPN